MKTTTDCTGSSVAMFQAMSEQLLRIFPRESLHYDLRDDFVGAGGFGEVYKAQIPNGEQVAVKKVDTRIRKLDPIEVDSLVKEANILTRLCHRNIVGLKGMCLDPCHFAIVLEFMTNGNLEDLLLEHRPAHPIVDLLQCRIRMGLDIAQGMKYLHGLISPIIHRDLKTANVLVDSSYCCKISNFGLSKTRCSSSQTLEGVHAGRLAFVAPERFRGDYESQQVDKQDVYAFSIILWQLKELKVPFEDEPNGLTVVNVMGGLRPPLSSSGNLQLANLICKCWNAVPSRRPPFHEIVQSMEQISSPPTPSAEPEPQNSIENDSMSIHVHTPQLTAHQASRMVESITSMVGRRSHPWPDLPKPAKFFNRVVNVQNKIIISYFHEDELCITDVHSSQPHWSIVPNTFCGNYKVRHLFTDGDDCYALLKETDRNRNSIARYRLDRNRWAKIIDFPSHIPYHLEGCAITADRGHRMYIVGGVESGTITDTVLVYDINTGKQCGRTKMRQKRRNCSCIVIDNLLYAGGGWNGDYGVNSIESISLTDYTNHAVMPSSTYSSLLTSVGGRLVASGGSISARSQTSASDSVSILDKHTNRWIPIPKMNYGRYYHGACQVREDRMMVIGGWGRHYSAQHGAELKSVECLQL